MFKRSQIISRVLRFTTILGELHSCPFMCHAPTPTILRVLCVRKTWLESQTSLIFLFKMFFNLDPQSFNICFFNDTLRDKALSIPLWRRLERSDLLIHQWLSKTGLVDFVVTVKAVTDHVDKSVFFKGFPV